MRARTCSVVPSAAACSRRSPQQVDCCGRTQRCSSPNRASDYKALVCVYLEGGNDGENTLIRLDGAGYQNYAAVRSPASGINIPQAQLHADPACFVAVILSDSIRHVPR